jgi:hypothetical protein
VPGALIMESPFQPDMVLTSIIEVGIAIAGFTGIVIAISRGDPARDETRALFISILLLTSFASVFFAFLPMLLSIAGLSESVVWPSSSAAFLVYFAGVVVFRMRRVAAVRAHLPTPIRVGMSVFLVAAAGQIPNLWLWREPWPYLVLLVAYVSYSFSVFVTLLWDMWQDLHEA